jgi:hypothetical protein
MVDTEALQARMKELKERDWDLEAIRARFDRLVQEGIPERQLSKQELASRREEILDRVQRRAEEYCFLTRNCAKGSATALMEEFGLGNVEMIRGLTPFPGIGMTGGACGGVVGGLLALGLQVSSDDPADFEDRAPYLYGRRFTNEFQEALGSLSCADVQELLLGRYYDPMGSLENLEAFNQSGARENCPLAPGMGARIAANIIIDALLQSS